MLLPQPIDPVEVDELTDADARAVGPWTSATLGLIEAHPGRRAPDLAGLLGMETGRFEPNVRTLKGLGLTESPRVGYRLSPRGEAFLARRPSDQSSP